MIDKSYPVGEQDGLMAVEILEGPECSLWVETISDDLIVGVVGTWWYVDVPFGGFQGWYPDHFVAYNEWDPWINKTFNGQPLDQNGFSGFDQVHIYDFLIQLNPDAGQAAPLELAHPVVGCRCFVPLERTDDPGVAERLIADFEAGIDNALAPPLAIAEDCCPVAWRPIVQCIPS